MTDTPGPLPTDTLVCRQKAEELLAPNRVEADSVAACAWALLAIAGELAVIRRKK